ncbi:hypothetical protein BDN72DRAFT_958334 [Pluteus cervinus]|uniref:Uncharacterized protein n=1 Tax=Pluteus cervinus TaxID=181527 RepID=A0ACD3AZ86_9AGAR|nr:hypothetical protein BDN72DRAFT_958334 [Pluteus cervinus]
MNRVRTCRLGINDIHGWGKPRSCSLPQHTHYGIMKWLRTIIVLAHIAQALAAVTPADDVDASALQAEPKAALLFGRDLS